MSIRQAVLTALLTAGIVGGTAAAASLADGGTETPAIDETTTSAPEVTTTTAVPDDEVADPEAGDDDGEGVERWYEGCGDFTEGNHGDYVRQAAQAEDATAESVREAAHSPCGKPVQSVHEDPEGDDDEVIEPEEPTEEAPAVITQQGNGNGGGNGKGKGGSKSRGSSNGRRH